MKKTSLIMIGLIILSILSGCTGQNFGSGETGTGMSDGDILIGIPGPMSHMKEITGFYNGVMMAVDEINTNGGINGRTMKVWFEDDKGTFHDGMKLAQEFVLEEEMTAVIGHWNTYITLPAAAVYDEAGFIMLSPIVSNTELTKKGYQHVFQNTISDHEMGRQMAVYAAEKGYRRIAIFYAENDYGNGLAKAFERHFADMGGQVVDRRTEFIGVREFNQAFEKWKAMDYDAVFVADSMPHAKEFITILRAKDDSVAILSGDGLDMADLPSMLGEAAEGILIGTMYHPENTAHKQVDFIKAYTKKYNTEPDVWAAQGYDSIDLLAYAIRHAPVPEPSEIAKVLHNNRDWTGVMGKAEFNANGEMTGRKVYIKTVRNGKMEFAGLAEQ